MNSEDVNENGAFAKENKSFKLTLKDKRKPLPLDVQKAKKLANSNLSLSTPDIQGVQVRHSSDTIYRPYRHIILAK